MAMGDLITQLPIVTAAPTAAQMVPGTDATAAQTVPGTEIGTVLLVSQSVPGTEKSSSSFTPKLGKAAALLHLLGSPKATFLLTDRCNLSCRHCFAPHGVGELEAEVMKSAIDELAGASDISYSGGEPFLYRNFLPLLHYTAARVKRVNVATNGTCLPPLSELPKNLTLILSADRYHAEAAAKAGKSLPDIGRRLYDETRLHGIGFSLFMRYPNDVSSVSDLQRFPDNVAVTMDVFSALYSASKVEGNHILRQNGALGLSFDEARPVNLSDFIDHAKTLGDLGIFITQKGLVTDNSHAAYMRNLPPFTVLGDLHTSSLFVTLRTRLLPGHFERSNDRYSRERFADRLKVIADGEQLFTDQELDSIAQSALSKNTRGTWSEVKAAVLDPESGVSWSLGYSLSMLYHIVGEAKFRELLRLYVKNFIDYIFPSDGVYKQFGDSYFYIEEGNAFLRDKPRINNYPENPWYMFESRILSVVKELAEIEGFETKIIFEDFLDPLYEALMQHKNGFRNFLYSNFLIVLFRSMRRNLNKPKPSFRECLKEWWMFGGDDLAYPSHFHFKDELLELSLQKNRP